jgi:hypothetical protein
MTSIVPNDRRAEASPASSLRGSDPSNLNRVLAEPNSASPAKPVLCTSVMLPTAVVTATVSSVTTRSCCRHSRRNMRPVQRIRARRAATPPPRGSTP